MLSGLSTFDVDFHEAEDGAPIGVTSHDLVAGQWVTGIRKGDTVQLFDEESGYVLANVLRVRNGTIWAEPLWKSWSSDKFQRARRNRK